MRNSTAIIIGFAMVAAAILIAPAIDKGGLIPPANAQSLDFSDFAMFSNGFSEVAAAIGSIRACRG